MQKFNVQSKTVSLVYCTNRTKSLMEKNNKKTIEQSRVREEKTMSELFHLVTTIIKDSLSPRIHRWI